MRNKQEKLEQIKKSCKVGQVLCRIFFILCIIGVVGGIVGAVLSGVGGAQLKKHGYSALITDENGNMISKEEIDTAIAEDPDYQAFIETDFPEFMDSMGTLGFLGNYVPESADFITRLVIICLIAAIVSGFTGFVFRLFGQVFEVVVREESPFTEVVMKKLRINFILLIVVMFLAMGLGAALVSGFLFWCIYSIFDYGCILQTEADETI